MIMNKYLYLYAGMIAMLCSCAPKDKYLIDGTAEAGKFQGQTVYLLDACNGNTLLDSAKVAEGKFRFEGVQAVPSIRTLRLHGKGDLFPVYLPVVLENGYINVVLGDIVLVEGTDQNDKLQDFLMTVSRFTDQDFSKVTPEVMKEQFQDIIVSQILINKDNEVGRYIYKTYSSKLTDEQKADVLSKTGKAFAEKVE